MLKSPFESGDRSPQRISKLSHLYHQLSTIKTTKNTDLISSQLTDLRSHSDQIKQLLVLIERYQRTVTKAIQELDDEFNDIHMVKHQMEIELSDLEKFISVEKNQYLQLKNQYIFKKKQRIAVSQSLNLTPLRKLQIQDRYAKCHQLFLWIIIVVYKQPAGKYYWQNFKQQVFQQDNGADFIQRLGRMSVTDLREQEKIVTLKLVQNRKEIEECEEFREQGVVHEVKKILDIAQLWINGYEISRRSKQIDSEDGKTKDDRILKQQSLFKSKAKLNAIQDRKNLALRYLKTLESILEELKRKQTQHTGLELDAAKAVRQLGTSVIGESPKNILMDVKVQEINLEEQVIF